MLKPPTRRSHTRFPNGRFGPGNPGRPKGSRNRVSSRLTLAILEHFDARHDEILDRLQAAWLPAYVRLMSSLLPRSADYALPDFSDFSDLEKARRVNEVRDTLDRVQYGEGTLLDLEAVLLGDRGP